MGGFELALGLGMGAISAASTYAQSQQAAAQYGAQARAMESQAQAAKIKGEQEAKQIEQRKTQLRNEYQDAQSANTALLASSNVDLTSGSALDVAQGNVQRFASDIADNAYARAMKEWETKTNVGIMNAQAGMLRSNARSEKDASLLRAAISGAGGFASGYNLAGGTTNFGQALKGGWTKLTNLIK